MFDKNLEAMCRSITEQDDPKYTLLLAQQNAELLQVECDNCEELEAAAYDKLIEKLRPLCRDDREMEMVVKAVVEYTCAIENINAGLGIKLGDTMQLLFSLTTDE